MVTTIGEKKEIARSLTNDRLLELFISYHDFDKEHDDEVGLEMKVVYKVLREEILRRMAE